METEKKKTYTMETEKKIYTCAQKGDVERALAIPRGLASRRPCCSNTNINAAMLAVIVILDVGDDDDDDMRKRHDN